MKALMKLKKGYGEVELREIPEPVPGPEEVKVEIKYCGICGTDMKIFHGEHAYYKAPSILGHEMIGTVTEIGKNVTGVEIGDNVVATESSVTKAKSLYGHSMDPWVEQSYRGFTGGGGFAKYGVYDDKAILKVPQSIDLKSGALLEPLACAVHAIIEKAPIHCNDIVVVSGPGPMGLLTAQLAKNEGGFVIILGRSADQNKLELALDLGIDMALNIEKQDTIDTILDISNEAGADLVFECVGVASSVSECMRLVRRYGYFIQVGSSAKLMEVDFAQIMYKELTVMGSFGRERIDWERSVRLLETGKVKTKPLISHILPLSAWHEAFMLFEEGKGVKILLCPDE
ncbi:MAG: zinc-binding dehydrogenase [Deltaproteobacteria bacterium]|nr:zinc-binding dehydrogenase [Deltaproteobacteria bacterium]